MKHTLGRSSQFKRALSIIIRISYRGYRISELANLCGVSTKTIRRDIRAIEDLDIPVYIEDTMYRVDRHWMDQFVSKEYRELT